MNDLDKLKDLLFGAEKEALDSIAERVERPETRTADVSDVLPEAIHQSHKKNSDLVGSLQEPVGECLQRAFREDPESYSDALYPVMGPAIRKSIAHTLRAFSKQINQVAEQSLTPKGLKWRFQAFRAGIPFSDFVVQKTLLYRVEQAYLMSRENGLLVDHVHHLASKIKDSDAVSAMFTAIQDFVKESFSPDRTGRLESADMGEFTLWAVHGPHALLVCVIRGVPPGSLRAELSAILEQIHFRYGEAIKNYSGDTSSMPSVGNELNKCLEYQASQDDDDSDEGGTSWSAIIIGGIVIAALAYFIATSWFGAKKLDALSVALKDAPGIYVADATRDGDQFLVRGMYDPVAIPVTDIVESLDMHTENVVFEMTPFQSLEPKIVRKRVDRLFVGIDTIDYEVSGSSLVVVGEATGEWIETAKASARAVAGIDAVDFNGVVDSNVEKLKGEVNSLSESSFLFAQGTSFAPGQVAVLREFSERVSLLQSRAAMSNYTVRLYLVGLTDNSGASAANERLALRRADAAAAILAEFGIASGRGAPLTQAPARTESLHDPSERSVVVYLTLVSAFDRS